VRLAFGALFIKQRLGLTDEETVEQIRENAYMGPPEKHQIVCAAMDLGGFFR
jgi:hypothetical protein